MTQERLMFVKIIDNSHPAAWYHHFDVSKYVFHVHPRPSEGIYKIANTPHNYEIFKEVKPILDKYYEKREKSVESYIQAFIITARRAKEVKEFKNNKEASLLLSEE